MLHLKLLFFVRCKDKGLPVTYHVDTGEVEVQLYSILTRRWMNVTGQLRTLAAVSPKKRQGYLCAGSWVGLRAGLDGCGEDKIPCPHAGSEPGLSCP